MRNISLILIALLIVTIALFSCQVIPFDNAGGYGTIEGYAKFFDKSIHSGIEVSVKGFVGGDSLTTIDKVTTDSEGRFVLKNIPTGIYVIEASHEGYFSTKALVRVDPDETTYLEDPLILYPIGDYGSLEGYAKFVDKYNHKGIAVQIRTPEGEPLPGMFTLTDEDGYYHFDMVPVGNYVVYAYDPTEDSEYSPDAASVEIKKGMTTIAPDLILRKAAQHVLILKDADAWGAGSAITDILEEIGFTQGEGVNQYEVKGSDYIESVDSFDPRWVIIIEGDQTDEFYQTYQANAYKFDNFVAAGGTLFWIACDNGHNEGDFTGELPGGVTWRDYYDYYNDIVNPTHPLLEGFPTDRPLQGIYASHGGFNNLDEASIDNLVVFIREHSTAEKYPTYIEYRYGKGRVIATTTPLEYYIEYKIYDWYWFILLLKRSIEYAFNIPLSPAE